MREDNRLFIQRTSEPVLTDAWGCDHNSSLAGEPPPGAVLRGSLARPNQNKEGRSTLKIHTAAVAAFLLSVRPAQADMPLPLTWSAGDWLSLHASSAGLVALGQGFVSGQPVFPTNNPWNMDISKQPVDPNSANLIASIGLTRTLRADFGTVYNGVPHGIPYSVVPGSQLRVPVSFTWPRESDPGPYPIPSNALIEGGAASTGDRHVIVVDRDNGKLYELYSAYRQGAGWQAGCGAVFDLNSNTLRPAGWTSADAAGLPIFPGLVRYEEAAQAGVISHALRFTVPKTRRGYVSPARHFVGSSTSANLPPMGMRVRLKASFNVAHYPREAQAILNAMKKYGMFVADHGSPWYLSGAPDPRWNVNALRTLLNVKGSNFEVVRMGAIVTR
jgi:hypothetical protein